MSKRLTLICILAIAVSFCVPAYAEVQNVKVSGDMTVRSLYRTNYDLDDNDNNASAPNPGDNADAYFMQSVGLNVDADLTDNVSTAVRIVNQRDWDNNSSATATFDVDVDLAYVTLKEMLYQPLTLTIGRQDLWFGRGLIVGTMLQPVSGTTEGTQTPESDYNASITAHEYSETTAFDAIRATLDLAPWKLDLLYSKVDENTVYQNDDVDLYEVNAGYKFDVYNGEAEAYYFGKVDETKPTTGTANSRIYGTLKVNTYGLRGSLEPVTNLIIGAEVAIQRGDYVDGSTSTNRAIRAYALNAYGKYSFPDISFKPAIGIEWLSLSGEDNVDDRTGLANGKWHGWDAMYRGKFDTAIRDFQNYLYATRARIGTTTTLWDQDSGMSNQNSLLIKGSVIPLEDVNLEGTYGHFWLNDKPNERNRGNLKTSNDVGDELDILLTYDYTEDVSFGLLTGWFFPGKVFPAGEDSTARDVVGSMKVVF